MRDRIVFSTCDHCYNGKTYKIMVYGIIKDVKDVNGFCVIPVKYNGKNNKVKDFDINKRTLVPGYNQYFSKTKEFNMGWAICAEPDVFNFDKGVEICKRRFSRSPISTQNGRFLTIDMCQAIVNNEVAFIKNNFHKYLPESKKMVNKPFVNMEILHNKNTEVNKNANNEWAPKVGDYVSFTVKDKKYLAIFREKIKSTDFVNVFATYFYGPVTNDGLIDHNNAEFLENIALTKNNQLNKANEKEVELVDAYLKGAHNREWDKNRKIFKLCIQ